MPEQPSLSLAEWVVLAIVDERPTHGFAVAALTVPGGELGRVWQIPRPVIYRCLPKLESLGLVEPGVVEPGQGPDRHPYSVTEAGRHAVTEWLATPVGHVREVRSHLLLKLALLDRRGQERTTLVRRQRQELTPIATGLQAVATPERAAGFDVVLAAWRQANVRATLDFLDELLHTVN